MSQGNAGEGDLDADGLWSRSLRCEVLPRLESYAARLGAGPHPLRERAAQRFLHSVLVSFDCGQRRSGIGIVVKIHRGTDRVRAAAAEYRHLQALHQHFGSDGEYRVPQPLDQFPEFGAVVMEQVFGTRLDRRIRVEASRMRDHDLQWSLRQCRRAGKWLQHLGARAGESRPSTEGGREESRLAWHRELERMLRTARSAGLSAQVASDVGGFLAGNVEPEGLAQPIHSDFSSYNAHATEHAIYFVDFADMPVGQLEECKAFFWSGLELVKMHPLLSEWALARCQDAFEAGCGSPVSRSWRAWGLLRQLSYMPPRNEPRSLRRRFWNRWRAAWIERRLRELVA